MSKTKNKKKNKVTTKLWNILFLKIRFLFTELYENVQLSNEYHRQLSFGSELKRVFLTWIFNIHA